MENTEMITCDDCGACCMAQCSPPFVPGDGKVESLPADVREDYARGMRARDEAGWPADVPCFWFDPETYRCRHYEHRPAICRDFEPGSEGCLSWRDEYNVC